MGTKKVAANKFVKKVAKTSTRKASVKPSVKSSMKIEGSAAVRPPFVSPDWRATMLDRMRALILAAAPGILEERKWKKPSNPAGVPVWSLNGIICTGETYKSSVKLTFMHGASLPDPARLFNAGLDGGTRRAIDLKEGESVDPKAFKALIKAAAALNSGSK